MTLWSQAKYLKVFFKNTVVYIWLISSKKWIHWVDIGKVNLKHERVYLQMVWSNMGWINIGLTKLWIGFTYFVKSIQKWCTNSNEGGVISVLEKFKATLWSNFWLPFESIIHLKLNLATKVCMFWDYTFACKALKHGQNLQQVWLVLDMHL